MFSCKYELTVFFEGDLVTDIVRRAYGVDAVIINGGCLKADRIIAAGAIRTKDVLDMVPLNDPVVVVKLKGSTICKILEHSVRGLKAKFPQISGLRMVYNENAEGDEPKMEQIWISRSTESEKRTLSKSYRKFIATQNTENGTECDQKCDGESTLEPIDPNAVYSIATRQFLFCGGLGFKWFEEEAVEVVVDEEDGVPLNVLLRNFFWAISAINDLLKMNEESNDGTASQQNRRRQSASMMRTYSLIPSPRKRSSLAHSAGFPDIDSEIMGNEEKEDRESEQYHEALVVAPLLEKRIMTVTQQQDVVADEVEEDLFGTMVEFMERLPSFAKMERLPRQQSLLMVFGDVHGDIHSDHGHGDKEQPDPNTKLTQIHHVVSKVDRHSKHGLEAVTDTQEDQLL